MLKGEVESLASTGTVPRVTYSKRNRHTLIHLFQERRDYCWGSSASLSLRRRRFNDDEPVTYNHAKTNLTGFPHDVQLQLFALAITRIPQLPSHHHRKVQGTILWKPGHCDLCSTYCVLCTVFHPFSPHILSGYAHFNTFDLFPLVNFLN